MDTAMDKPTDVMLEVSSNEQSKLAGKEIDDFLRTIDNSIDQQHALIELPEEDQKKIMWKIDVRLIPLLTILYLVAFIDRSNSRATYYIPKHPNRLMS
jgi:hypothetical protein